LILTDLVEPSHLLPYHRLPYCRTTDHYQAWHGNWKH